MNVYTNSTATDTIRNAFYSCAEGTKDILIASPFFSYNAILEEILKQNNECLIRLIIKLGPSTLPYALKKIIKENRIHIRYFTSPTFHSKLYIFGNKVALVGSANLTESGFQSNREICLEITQEDERFDRLLMLYNSYWNQAEVLTAERLHIYLQLYEANGCNPKDYQLEQNIIKKFGNISPSEGIQVGKKKASKEKIFLESYRRIYQEFLTAFRIVETLYKQDSRRQQPEDIVPLRIEIDQFFSFIRECHAIGDSYKTSPLLSGREREDFIKGKLDEWFSRRWKYLGEKIPDHINRINSIFSSKETIVNANMEQLLDALTVCHSFHDRLRFFPGGGLETLKNVFISGNELQKIKDVFSYLLHGNEDFITRVGTCIFDERYSLNQVGRSVIQELLGWINKENVPICNGRTVKALRYLGFNIVVFN